MSCWFWKHTNFCENVIFLTTKKLKNWFVLIFKVQRKRNAKKIQTLHSISITVLFTHLEFWQKRHNVLYEMTSVRLLFSKSRLGFERMIIGAQRSRDYFLVVEVIWKRSLDLFLILRARSFRTIISAKERWRIWRINIHAWILVANCVIIVMTNPSYDAMYFVCCSVWEFFSSTILWSCLRPKKKNISVSVRSSWSSWW